MLAEQFSADQAAADWRRFGRAPGFTNRKPQHRSAQGLYPFARLHSATGETFANAPSLHARLVKAEQRAQQERAAVRRSPAVPLRAVTLLRFRTSHRYAGRPAAADMAFFVATCSQGWPESDIAAELRRDYLSRNTNAARRAAYIRRTISKAMRWAV